MTNRQTLDFVYPSNGQPGPVTAWLLTPSLKTHPPTTMSFGCQGPGRATRTPVTGFHFVFFPYFIVSP